MTECVTLMPYPGELPSGMTVQVEAVEVRHILVAISHAKAAHFYTEFSRHLETSYDLDPREKFRVYYSLDKFSIQELDCVVEKLRRWIEEWLDNN